MTQTVHPPILQFKTLKSVYDFVSTVDDGDLNELARRGVGSNSGFGDAATLGFWIAHQSELLLKKKLSILFPLAQDTDGASNLQPLTTPSWCKLVACLLGRESNSLDIRVISTGDTKGRLEQFDAVWLGYLAPGNAFKSCLKNSWIQSVSVPIGFAAESTSCQEVTLSMLKLGGYRTDGYSLNQSFSEDTGVWEQYQHSESCALVDPRGYVTTLVANTGTLIPNPEERESSARDWVHSFETQERLHLTWVDHQPVASVLAGEILKSEYDPDQAERYIVLGAEHILRISDFSIMEVGHWRDFRGPVVAKLSSNDADVFPGLEEDWTYLNEWCQSIVEKYTTQLTTRMVRRADSHQFIQKLCQGELDGAARSLLKHYGPSLHHDTSEDAKVFFALVAADRLNEASEQLRKHPHVADEFNADTDSPLILAVEAANLALVKLCLELKVDVNYIADDGFSALHLAAREGHTTIAGQLIKAGATLDAPTWLGWTPLTLSIMREKQGCARLLVRHGADTQTDFGVGSAKSLAKKHRIALI